MSERARLRAPRMEERVAAMARLAEAGRPSAEEVAALLDCLGDARKLVQRRAAETFAVLARRGLVVRPMLCAALAEDAWRLRWGAAFALSLIGEPPAEAVEVLLEVLGWADADLRWAALDLLRRIAAHSRGAVVPRLIELAVRGNSEQRKMALYGLRDLNASEAAGIEAARAALDAAEVDVRLAGLSAFAQLATDREAAARRLVPLLTDRDERMRRAAASTLGVLGDRSPEVLAALHGAQGAADPSLRRAAARALRLLGESGSGIP